MEVISEGKIEFLMKEDENVLAYRRYTDSQEMLVMCNLTSEEAPVTLPQGMLGEGIAIIPADGEVYAPCNATVDTMFETGHACSLVAENGAEILIHVGLETVGLGGKCFKVHVKNGQKVKKGQLMFEADLEGIKAAGLNTITPVLVCNVDDFASLNGHTGNAVTNDDVVIELSK